jgi:hypothetical protein
MATGTTYTSRLTRNELFRTAYRRVGGNISDPQYIEATRLLNAIIREKDKIGEHLWAEAADPTTLTLSQDVAKYSAPASNISRLVSVMFRNASMEDVPVIVSTGRQYNELTDKLERADVIDRVYLSEEIDLSSRSIFVHPVLSSVNSQSEVTGTDALNYSCIRNHVGDTDNKPITGTNYLQYWEQVGSSGVAWVDGTSYTAPQLLVIKYARPLFDFADSQDDPDIPAGYDRWLSYKLSIDLALSIPDFPSERLREFMVIAVESESQLFEKSTPQTDDTHNKTEFF